MERDAALLWDSFVMRIFVIDILVSIYLISLQEWLLDLVVFVADVVLIPLLIVPVLIGENGYSDQSRATDSLARKWIPRQMYVHTLLFLAYLILAILFSLQFTWSDLILRYLGLSLLANLLFTATCHGWWNVVTIRSKDPEIRGNGI